MTQRYCLTSPKFEGGALYFEYENDVLTRYHGLATLPDEIVDWLAANFPTRREYLERIAGASKTLVLRLVIEKPTFQQFWEAYDYKVGNKTRALKLWCALSEAEQVGAVEAIPAYNYYLACRPNMERLYPETWLSQKRFESDFKALNKAGK